jgi:hypothetical protein
LTPKLCAGRQRFRFPRTRIGASAGGNRYLLKRFDLR